MRLYADYLNREYGALDSDYVFVNLWGRPHGHPLTYPAVYDLVGRLRRRTGVDFGPHCSGTPTRPGCCVEGAGMESVKELLGHASITTTVDTYGHLTRRGRPRDVGGCGLVHRTRGPVVNPASTSAEPSRCSRPACWRS